MFPILHQNSCLEITYLIIFENVQCRVHPYGVMYTLNFIYTHMPESILFIIWQRGMKEFMTLSYQNVFVMYQEVLF